MAHVDANFIASSFVSTVSPLFAKRGVHSCSYVEKAEKAHDADHIRIITVLM